MAARLGGGTYARGETERTLEYAVAASLALHAVLLLTFPDLTFLSRQAAPIPAPLVVRLAEEKPQSAPVVEEPAPVLEAPSAPPESEPAWALTPKPKPKPKPKPVARARPLPEAERAAPPPPAAAPAAVVEAAPATAPSPVASVAPQRLAPEPTADQGDDAMLAQYRLAVIAAARRYKRYPRAALDNNWNGKAEVRMTIGANGVIASMSIKSSSGHDILDRQALDMIRKAKPLTPIPESLRGREFAVDIPVIFSLEEPNS